MICFGIGILLIIAGIVAFIVNIRETLDDWMHPMAGLGLIFTFAYWLVLTLFGIISILIGFLLRK